ncbi:hypothetical protein [Yersinia aleksiciae]|uniref:N-acetylglucosamine-binding protein A n=1 Tax=Yersinia aleksiciae TaxID=263819 RepID=A0ABM5UAD0_YERAE|nr:hypothetical protein [Yersinia aleksiciae]AKP32755.1 hypothetical protein ACZ76_03915 [Yersinia aleksiciae]MDA5498029.1 hypothetical protein [Yersinia aleksiciae]NIL00255.1 hypothetical protein [Yersinia aleksiciae]WQC71645.1 hypothetical protein N0K21_04035 [Yersinia aleksiciae]CFQ50678.1 Uncharacterised protein [Yersinia aleksiciae]
MKISAMILFCTPFISPYCTTAADYSSSSQPTRPSPVVMSATDYHRNDNFPEFSIENFNVQQHTAAREAEIKFTLKSSELLYYHVYLNDKDNNEIMNTLGFVNNDQQSVSLKMTSTWPGDYEVVIELVDNNKMTVLRNYNITLD